MGFAPSWPKQVIFFPFFLTVVNYTKHFSSLPLLSMWFSGVNVAQQCEYVYLQNAFHLAKLKLVTH